VRAINTTRGVRRKDDKPPENHWKKRFTELEKELLDTYYAFKGWNEQGIPTEETLRDLGLDYVYEEFVKRGVYADEGEVSSQATPAETGKEV
jgi:benzoyl-CoA reductase subunit BamB